jgi:hypothetical protein
MRGGTPVLIAITNELGGAERFFSEVVYPAWPLWALGTILVLVSAAYLAYRAGRHLWAMEHKAVTGAALAILVAVTVPAGYYTVSPLFERQTVCEASPLPAAEAGSGDCGDQSALAPSSSPSTQGPGDSRSPAATFEPVVVAKGDFTGADDFHFGEGQALLIETAPGQYVLRFEEFSVRNGPDLFVYLSPDPAGYSSGALKLGGLKGTDGAFNYEIPEGTDVSQFKSAVIWCEQFSVLFATAAIM